MRFNASASVVFVWIFLCVFLINCNDGSKDAARNSGFGGVQGGSGGIEMGEGSKSGTGGVTSHGIQGGIEQNISQGGSGGEEMGGSGGEGMLNPQDCVDTGPLPSAALNAGLGPTSRINSFLLPGDKDEAIEFGCDEVVVGSNHGYGIIVLNALSGSGLDNHYRRNEEGEIKSVVFIEADGWNVDETGNQTNREQVSLLVYDGVFDSEEEVFELDPKYSPPNASDPTSFARANVGCSRMDAESDTFSLPFFLPSEAEGLPTTNLELSHIRLSGDLEVNQEGWYLRDALLTGHFTREQMIDWVTRIKIFCSDPLSNSDRCGQINQLFAGDDVEILVADVVLPIFRNLDSKVTDEGVFECEGDCNAVSICARISTTPVNIQP